MKTFKILSSTTLKFIINYCCVPQSSKCARAAPYEVQRCLPVSPSALFFDTDTHTEPKASSLARLAGRADPDDLPASFSQLLDYRVLHQFYHFKWVLGIQTEGLGQVQKAPYAWAFRSHSRTSCASLTVITFPKSVFLSSSSL